MKNLETFVQTGIKSATIFWRETWIIVQLLPKKCAPNWKCFYLGTNNSLQNRPNFFCCYQAKKGHRESFHYRMWSDRSVDLASLKYVTKCLLQLQHVCISESLFSVNSLCCLSLFTTLENLLSLGFSPIVTSCNGYLLKVPRHEPLVGESYTLVVF